MSEFHDSPSTQYLDWVFWILLCVFLYAITHIGLHELLNMYFYDQDFSFYDNSIWNASRGLGLHCNLLHGKSYLGTHFSPILYLFVPFYWLGAGPWFLICLRSLAASGGAILIRYYGKNYTNLPKWAGNILGISFLMHPLMHMATLSNFHGMTLELFFIPLILIALKSEKRWFFWVSFFLLLSVREDTWLYTTALAGLLLWQKDKKLAIQVIVISVIWGILALGVFMPFFYGGSQYIGQKNPMFSAYLTRYKNYFQSGIWYFLKPRLIADFRVLFPLAFLPLLGGQYFLLMLLPLVQIQLGQTYLQKTLLHHYPACVLPFAYIAGYYGWQKLQKYTAKKGFAAQKTHLVLAVCILIFSLFSLKTSIAVERSPRKLFVPYLINPRNQTAFKLLKKIPKNASLSLQGSLFLIGCHRKEVYAFCGYPSQGFYSTKKTDYVMVDTGSLFPQVKNYRSAIDKLLSGVEYGVVNDKDGFILLKKGYPPDKNPVSLQLYRYRIQGEKMSRSSKTSRGEWNTRFDWKAIRIAREKRDKEGIMACGRHRVLNPGVYHVRFSLFLNGIPGWAAAGLVVKGKTAAGGRQKYLSHKTVKFSKKTDENRIVSLTFTINKKTEVEPIVFYGGHGVVGLDYVEFVRQKGL